MTWEMIALFVVGLVCAWVLWMIYTELLKIEQMIAWAPDETEPAHSDPPKIKPNKRRRSRRFTDKSRDWLTAKEAASRR